MAPPLLGSRLALWKGSEILIEEVNNEHEEEGLISSRLARERAPPVRHGSEPAAYIVPPNVEGDFFLYIGSGAERDGDRPQI